ncbi:MAG: DUF5702 domain-containing protein [Faecalibacterium sp.]
MKFRKRVKEDLIKKTEGAISLLLILLLVPFYSVAAILVEVGRYQSACNGLDAAINASELSVLAQYDSYLMERFGLLAINQDISIDAQFSSYLEKQDTLDTRSFDLSGAGIRADGVYPLADIQIMRQQIEELAKLLVPSKVAMDFGDFSNLTSQLESYKKMFSNVTNMLTSMENALQGGLDSYNAQKEAKRQMEVVVSSTQEYNAFYEVFRDSLFDLQEHLNSERPEDEDAAAEWDSRLATLKDAAEEAKTLYQEAIESEKGDISTLAKKFDTAISKEVSAGDQVVDILTGYGTLMTEDANKPLEDEKKRVDGESKNNDLSDKEKEAMKNAGNEVEKEINGNKNSNSLSDTIVDASKRSEDVKDTLENYNSEACATTVRQLTEEAAALEKINFENITDQELSELLGTIHLADTSKFQNTKQFDELWNQVKKSVEGDALQGTLGDTLNALLELINIDVSYNPELNVVLDTDYYNQTFGGLPSQKNRSMEACSLESPFESDDAWAAQNNLRRMGLLKGEISRQITSGTSLQQDSGENEDGKDSNNIFKKLLYVTNMLKSRISAMSNMLSAIGDVGKQMGEGFLLKGYLAYSLSTRNNFSSGSSLTGQSYSAGGGLTKVEDKSEASLMKDKLVGLVPGIESSERKGYSFCGAELEYVMFGKMSEKQNQKAAYNRLVLLHLLLGVVQVYSNAFVQSTTHTLATACAVIPGGSAVVEMLLPLVFAYANATVDAVILCNGGDVPLIKTNDDLNVTPAGMVKALNQLTSLKVATELSGENAVNKALNKLKEATGQGNGNGNAGGTENAIKTENSAGDTLQMDTDQTEKKSLIDPGKYVDSINSLNYDQYLLMLLMVFWNNEEELLNRFADIIQMEQTNRVNTVNNTQYTLEQQLEGTRRSFDIDRAYTVVRAQVHGKFVNVLPVPTLSRSSSWGVSRTLYRGY